MEEAKGIAPHQAFFVTGGAISFDSPSYVERACDHDLCKSLKGGDFCYVLTARQMGKSSLMVRTAQELRATGTRVAILDTTRIGSNVTVEQWYDSLLWHLGRFIDLEDELSAYWTSHQSLPPLLRFFSAIEEVALKANANPLVVFVDEIDGVRNLNFQVDEFFAAIRELYNRRSFEPHLSRLTFCLLGVATPSELIQNPHSTPFNIGQDIKIQDFSLKESLLMARGFSCSPKEAISALERIHFWTNGHPYLTQRLCLECSNRGIDSPSDIDAIVNDLFLTRKSQASDPNLSFVRKALLQRFDAEPDRDRKCRDLLTLYCRILDKTPVVNNEADSNLANLKLSGIIKEVDGHLIVRNKIYATAFDKEWVENNAPQNESRIVRKAAIRSAALTSIVAMAILVPLLANKLIANVRKVVWASRGSIFSADGQLLAYDRKVVTITLSGRHSYDAKFLTAFSELIKVPVETITARVVIDKKSAEWIRPDSDTFIDSLSRLKRTYRIDGLGFFRAGVREYPMGRAFSGLIGYIHDSRPKLGIELGLESEIEGHLGVQSLRVLPKFGVVSKSIEKTPKSGGDVVLTIVSDLQRNLTHALAIECRQRKVKFGTIIVMDSRDGAILAMANFPTFDPSSSNEERLTSEFNIAYMSAYAPGSLFTVPLFARAIDKGVIEASERMICTGSLQVGQHVIRDDWGIAHGAVTFADGVNKRCNVVAATIALRLGYEDTVQAVRDLGLFDRPEIGLPGTTKALFNFNESARKLQAATLGFGQSISLSPLHLASCFATLANGGSIVHPRLIDRIGNQRMPVSKTSQYVRPESASEALLARMSKSYIVGASATKDQTGAPEQSVFMQIGIVPKSSIVIFVTLVKEKFQPDFTLVQTGKLYDLTTKEVIKEVVPFSFFNRRRPGS